MYNKDFSEFYNKAGWELFTEVFGNFIIHYCIKKDKPILNALDLACGTGFLCNLFSKYGIDCTGIDLSPHMINLAKEKYKNINFKKANMINYKNENKVDLVTCTCDSLNHLNSLTNLHNTVSTAFNNLNENGYFIFDIINTRKILLDKLYSTKNEKATIEYFFESDEKLEKLQTTIKVILNDSNTFKTKIEQLVINKSDMDSILKEVGFKIEKVYKKIKYNGIKLDLKWFYVCKKVIPKKKGRLIKNEKSSTI